MRMCTNKAQNFKSLLISCAFSAGRMARTKMSVQKSRLPVNPFSRINAHGAQLLDVNRIQGLCQAAGKNA